MWFSGICRSRRFVVDAARNRNITKSGPTSIADDATARLNVTVAYWAKHEKIARWQEAGCKRQEAGCRM